MELLCALDTLNLPRATTPTYADFEPGGALVSRLQHLCRLCEVQLVESAPAATRMHLWLKLTRIYVNAIRAYIADAPTYESHYRDRLSSEERQFVEAMSLKRPSRGPLFQALLPLAVQDELISQTAKVLTWQQVRQRLATESCSPKESS